MGHDNVYLVFGRLKSERWVDKGLLKFILNTSGMSFMEKLEHNLDPEIWSYRIQHFGYLIKDAINYFKK